jgi:UDP-glucose 4-epimerase
MAFYLVTGGAGFIGSHLVERLLRDGHKVRVLDDFSTGRKENLQFPPPVETSLLEVVEGDLRDWDTTVQATTGTDGIFHLGAVPSVFRSVLDPVTTVSVNVLGTVHVLTAARDRGVRRVVFASSSSVYGDWGDQPISEDVQGEPLSPYALSKRTGEAFMGLFSRLFGLETVSLRYFNVFGPRQDPKGEYAAAIPKFITLALQGKPLPIYGDGNQTRDFTYVDIAIEATVRAMEAPLEGGEVFNVAAGNPVNLLALVGALEEILGYRLEVEHLEPRPGEIRHSAANIERSRQKLGFNPSVSFYEGLERTVAAFKEAHG